MNIIQFPESTGKRVLMMPYIQGDPDSVPNDISDLYGDIIESTFIERGTKGFLTIDESNVTKGQPHRGKRSKYARALHTEAGLDKHKTAAWGSSPVWGGRRNVVLDRDLEVLLANSIDDTCAIWDAIHEDTTDDGDIGHLADMYPYKDATLMKSGEVHRLGIFTPHESLMVDKDLHRQFLRIVGSGVHGREPYFTINPLIAA